ncbi:MAG: hypothetical protein ACFCD0_20630 [Gemmataceae bacterium]
MYTAGNVILLLKVAVSAVSVLIIAALISLALKKPRIHGWINTIAVVLTLTALLGLEVFARVLDPDLFDNHFTDTDTWTEFYVHLAFAVPAAILLPIMWLTGRTYRVRIHLPLGIVFLVAWIGTFITGVFFLPH